MVQHEPEERRRDAVAVVMHELHNLTEVMVAVHTDIEVEVDDEEVMVVFEMVAGTTIKEVEEVADI